MTLILDGRKARDAYQAKLIDRVERLAAQGIDPRLAIIQVGDNPESAVYIEQKKRFGAKLGVAVEHVRLPETATDQDVAAAIGRFNGSPEVHGIIMQLPVPPALDSAALLNHIDPRKDVDGLTDENQRLLAAGGPRFVPATAKGVGMLLDHYGIEVSGKRAAVFGRSRLVGGPLAALLRLRGAEVSVIHSKTPDPERESRAADIVIVAIGKPRYVGAKFISPGAVIVDVGINAVSAPNTAAANGKAGASPRRALEGDVDFTAVEGLCSAISPVPGGVGPMTVLALFDNLISSAESFIS